MEEHTTKANLSLRQNVIDKIMQGKTYAADVSKDLIRNCKVISYKQRKTITISGFAGTL